MTVKISELPAAGAANDADELEANQAGTSRKVTRAQIVAGLATDSHGSTHISTGSDPVPAAVAGGASGLLTGADKNKIDGIEANAEVNDVTSVHGRTGAVVGVKGDYDGVGMTDVAVAGATTLDNADFNKLQRYTGAGNTWTFNDASEAGVIPIINKGTGDITTASGTATVEGASLIPANSAACAVYYGDGSNVRVVVEQ